MKKEYLLLGIIFLAILISVILKLQPKVITRTITVEKCGSVLSGLDKSSAETLAREEEWMRVAVKSCPNGLSTYRLEQVADHDWLRPNFTCK